MAHRPHDSGLSCGHDQIGSCGWKNIVVPASSGLGGAGTILISSDGVFSDSTVTQRTVVIGLMERSSEPGELHGTLLKGEPVNEAREAEVLSDRDCAPDADGVSHCLNELGLGSRQVTIRHHHRMGEVPCLRPGEIVTVVGAETFEDRGSA